MTTAVVPSTRKTARKTGAIATSKTRPCPTDCTSRAHSRLCPTARLSFRRRRFDFIFNILTLIFLALIYKMNWKKIIIKIYIENWQEKIIKINIENIIL